MALLPKVRSFAVAAGARIGIRGRSDRNAYLLISLAALVASATRILRGVSCGHDFDFHVISWMETQRSWSQGVLYPHWAQSPNWDAGEPRFVFYPPLSWIFGALLGYAMSWDWASALFAFLCFLGAGLTTRALARRFLPAANATLAGVLAAVTPYSLFVAYERSAFSELAAAVWIPLLLLLAMPDGKTAAPSSVGDAARQISEPQSKAWPGNPRSPVALAIVLAVVWLTNAPAGVMACYLLAFASLAAAWLHRSWTPIIRAAIATPIGIGMAGIYLVPAAWEQRWIAINQALDIGMRVQDSWLFARHDSPGLELHDQVLLYASVLFALTTLMAGLGFGVCLLRKKLPQQTRGYWIPLALLIPGLLLLQLPVSSPIWHLPKLEFLQFPWRWLMVLATPYAIFCAAATPLGTSRQRIRAAILWTAVLLFFSGAASRIFYQLCDDEDQIGNQMLIFSNGVGMEGTDEYAPTDADNSLVAGGLPDGCLVDDPTEQLGEGDKDASPDWWPEQGSCDDTYKAQIWQTEHKLLKIDSDHDGYIVLRLRRYPAWRITVNGVSIDPVPSSKALLRDDGLMLIPVKEGPSTIEVRWITTPDEIWGRWISIVSLASLLLIWGLFRRSSNPITAPHLS